MVALSLKISIGNAVKTMQFEPSTMVYDACRIIRERVPEAQMGQRKWPGFHWRRLWRGRRGWATNQELQGAREAGPLGETGQSPLAPCPLLMPLWLWDIIG